MKWEQLDALLIDRQWQLINLRSKDIGSVHKVVIQFQQDFQFIIVFVCSSFFCVYFLCQPDLSVNRAKYPKEKKISFKLHRSEEAAKKWKQNRKTFVEKETTKQLIIIWFVFAPKPTDLQWCWIANCPIESKRRKVSLFLSL